MILAVDPGLRTWGWAIVVPRIGRVVACDARLQLIDSGATTHADRQRRAALQADVLATLISRHSVTSIAAEEMSFAPRGSAASKIGIGLSWGVLVGLAASSGLPLRAIPPKTWQRAIVPAGPGEKRTAAIDYNAVYTALADYVDCDLLLASVPKSQRNHALDACGVGVYAALVPEDSP